MLYTVHTYTLLIQNLHPDIAHYFENIQKQLLTDLFKLTHTVNYLHVTGLCSCAFVVIFLRTSKLKSLLKWYFYYIFPTTVYAVEYIQSSAMIETEGLSHLNQS